MKIRVDERRHLHPLKPCPFGRTQRLHALPSRRFNIRIWRFGSPLAEAVGRARKLNYRNLRRRRMGKWGKT